MYLLLLIGAFLVLGIADAFGRSVFPWPTGATAVVVGGAAGGAASVSIAGWYFRRSIDRRGRARDFARFEVIALVYRLWLLATFAVGTLLFGWLGVVRSVVGDLPLIDEAIAILPMLAGVTWGFLAAYPFERRLREARLMRDLDAGRPVHAIPTRARYVSTSMRHHVLFMLAPLSAILLWSEVLETLLYAPDGSSRGWSAWVTTGGIPAEIFDSAVQLGGAFVIFAVMPLALRWIWRTVRVPDGPLRDRLTAVCDAHRVRVRDILIWRTDGGIVNAAVTGLLPSLRYVVISDALLELLSDEQVEAVAAHEVGHVKRRHLPWLAISILAIVLTAGTLLGWAARLIPVSPFIGQLLVLAAAGLTLVFTLVVFGWVSRRFEWQADAFAAQHLSGVRDGEDTEVRVRPEAVHAMITALGRVASLNGLPVRRFTWRHGSVRTRQLRLAALVDADARCLLIDRRVGRLKVAALVLLAIGIAITAVDAVLLAPDPGGPGIAEALIDPAT